MTDFSDRQGPALSRRGLIGAGLGAAVLTAAGAGTAQARVPSGGKGDGSAGRRAVAKTRHPSRLSALAQYAPIPDDAPVTMIVRNSCAGSRVVLSTLAIWESPFPYSRAGDNRLRRSRPESMAGP